MAENQEQSTGWTRARDALKNARVTAEVAATVFNPLAGPVAQHAHLEPVANQQAIVRQINQEKDTQYAHWDLLRREQEAGRVEQEPKSARPDPAREPHPRRQPNHDASRNRQRGN